MSDASSCEPVYEHSLSYITWLNVLGPASEMQVGFMHCQASVHVKCLLTEKQRMTQAA
jgi:hypothetical protein